mmetsp:Transcript_15440/g.29116  ORF Transcript_15440/g.29116 Transcript_15440/m.29116 type:complete len:186 (+) Transcript_15440:49-606(+)
MTRLLHVVLSLVISVAVSQAENRAQTDQSPSHAGCFVKKGKTMLAVKLTYDGNLFDIPGGRTDGREPAPKTAERETWEESGYPVEVGELLATVRGGFRIFRCHLKQQNPGKGPDHEVSSVQWINDWEVENFIQQHMWRFQDAQAPLYLQWLHDANMAGEEVQWQQGQQGEQVQEQDGGHRRLLVV